MSPPVRAFTSRPPCATLPVVRLSYTAARPQGGQAHPKEPTMSSRLTPLLLLCCLFVAFAGCGSRSADEEAGATMEYAADAMRSAAPMAMDEAGGMNAPSAPPAPPAGGSVNIPAQRKVIFTGALALEVDAYTAAETQLLALVRAAGGYIANQSSSKYASGGLRGSIEVKLPPEKLDAFIAEVKQLGDLRSESRQGQDITLEYTDLTSRVKVKQQLESELLGLLHSSSPRLSEKLDVERELARVREEIETIQGRLKYYDAMVAMATLTVELMEPATVAPEDDNILFEAVKDGIEGLMRSLGALIIFVMVATPWVLLLVVILLLIRAWWRRRKRTREAKA